MWYQAFFIYDPASFIQFLQGSTLCGEEGILPNYAWKVGNSRDVWLFVSVEVDFSGSCEVGGLIRPGWNYCCLVIQGLGNLLSGVAHEGTYTDTG